MSFPRPWQTFVITLVVVCCTDLVGGFLSTPSCFRYDTNARMYLRGSVPFSAKYHRRMPKKFDMSSGGKSSQSGGRPLSLYELSSELTDAVRQEDYSRAAKLRDEIKIQRVEDPVSCALDSMSMALAKQDFKTASLARDQLAREIIKRAKGPKSVAVNRLLIQLRDGGLLTCNPEGKYSVVLSDESDKGKYQHFQATWSPTADLIAYTRIDLRTKDTTASEVFVVWANDGAVQLTFNAAFVPFYFFWTPSGARLTYLTTFADDIKRAVGLDFVKVWQEPEAGESLNSLLDDGRVLHLQDGTPLFYAFSPRDNRIAVHIGDKQKIAVFEPATLSEVVLSTKPGPFRSLTWLPRQTPDGADAVLFLEAKEGQAQRLVLAEAHLGGRKREIVETLGFTSFAISPDGQRLALMCKGPRQQDGDYLSIMDGPFDFEDDPWPAARTPVAGAMPDAKEQLLEPSRGVFAYFWSPDSLKLLVLTGPGRNNLDEQQGLRWEVFDIQTEKTTIFQDFIPTASYVGSLLPFFDQYALSQTPWSPDSTSFCYSGRSFAQEDGAWVQKVPPRGQPAPPPTLVWENAELVSWSPR